MVTPLRILTFFMALAVLSAGIPAAVFAQEPDAESAAAMDEQEKAPDQDEIASTAADRENENIVNKTFEVQKPLFNPVEYNSLFFTVWEVENIARMRRIANSNDRGLTRAILDPNVGQEFEDPALKVKPPPEQREIRLAGILYNGSESWTIWLNEKRVTPDALPREVIDLKVYKEYIEFKWFDDYTNRIYPIRLRPHQRFNIDTRIFLPG